METGYIIRLLRTAQEVSQGELAEKLGITRTYLSQIENGHRNPSLPFLKDIAGMFQVPLVLLVAGQDEHLQSTRVHEELRRVLAELLAVSIPRPKDGMPHQKDLVHERTDYSKHPRS